MAFATALVGMAASCFWGALEPAGNAAAEHTPRAGQARSVEWNAGAARHVLDRFAFGPRPGEVEALVELGFERWLEAQLSRAPECGSPLSCDAPLRRALEPYAGALRTPAELVGEWME